MAYKVLTAAVIAYLICGAGIAGYVLYVLNGGHREMQDAIAKEFTRNDLFQMDMVSAAVNRNPVIMVIVFLMLMVVGPGAAVVVQIKGEK